jgi:HD-GYP domain-containing protein (c-di-GMP phosphodiesterase class II)
MAHLIIWGDPRSVLAGGSHAGVNEVRSFAALEAALDGGGAALVLADAERLEAEKGAVEAWLRNGGSARAVIVAVAEGGDHDELLQRLPFVDDVLVRPVSPMRLRHKVERAIDFLGKKSAIRQLEKAYSRRGEELSKLNEIGVALSAERDIDRLLELILSKSREITVADAGSLYLVERDHEGSNGNGERLRFKLPQNDSVGVSDFQEFTVPLDKTSIAGYVALTGETVSLADAYHPPSGAPYTISRSFDEKSGYRSRSMLVVPMKDHKDVVIGVVQLINKKRERDAVLQSTSLVDDQVISFSAVDRDLVESLASQAAVAIENADLIRRMRKLFDDFVDAAVTAIEQRDPTTRKHSRRVAILTVGLIEKVDTITTGPLKGLTFTRDQVEEVRYAALLHDFGKVAVKEKYLRKGKKLYASQMIAIKQRFAFILRAIEADYLRAKLAALESGRATREALAAIDSEYQRRRAEAERIRDAVMQANEPSVVEEHSFSALMNLPVRSFPPLQDDPNTDDQSLFEVEDWADGPFLSAKEREALSIRKGSLSEPEREQINSHVSHTYEFLNSLPWTRELRTIPEIAWAHHEKLNGSGYPRGLKGLEIMPQSRMMTISDIFDALVAWDRPYKSSVDEGEAIRILRSEADEGKIDKDLLQVFLEAEIYRLPEFTELLQKKA